MRVIRGRILDVAVDLRRSSPTFGRHVAIELTRRGRRTSFSSPSASRTASARSSRIPRSSTKYPITIPRQHDHGIAWDDPALGIQWPVAPGEAVLSEKDTRHPVLADLPRYFD